MKKIYFCSPLHLSANKITSRGKIKRKFKSFKELCFQLWKSIEDFFTETYIVEQTEIPIYDSYFDVDINGNLSKIKPPVIVENEEELIIQTALAIHQCIPPNE